MLPPRAGLPIKSNILNRTLFVMDNLKQDTIISKQDTIISKQDTIILKQDTIILKQDTII
jgi:hypothetical protein